VVIIITGCASIPFHQVMLPTATYANNLGAYPDGGSPTLSREKT
jgi:hypothetical protein